MHAVEWAQTRDLSLREMVLQACKPPGQWSIGQEIWFAYTVSYQSPTAQSQLLNLCCHGVTAVQVGIFFKLIKILWPDFLL